MNYFLLLLKSPNQGFYVPGMKVTGTVLVATDEPKYCEAIEVSFHGFASVRLISGGEEYCTYTSKEDFLSAFVCVWNKSTSAENGRFPAGRFSFPFSFRLVGENLPSSYKDPNCSVEYIVEARTIRGGLSRLDTVLKATIKVVDLVKINHPNLLQPKSIEIDGYATKWKYESCFGSASGPITVRVSTPRTGYCIQRDSITMTVFVENGSFRKIRKVVVSLRMVVECSAEGEHCNEHHTLVTITSGPIPAQGTMEWQPPLIPLSDIPVAVPVATINCRIIKVNYFLRVETFIRCAVTPPISIPLVLSMWPAIARNRGWSTHRVLPPHPLGFMSPTQP